MKEKIRRIIDTRHSRIPGINVIKTNYQNLQNVLSQFEALKSKMVDDNGEVISGPYEQHLKKRPDMVQRLFRTSSCELSIKISKQIERLDRIKKRFNRDEISIQVYGNAGNGKSTFIQRVAKLDDKVIPTTSLDEHCTGASSYIKNSSTFSALVYFYTEDELLTFFNKGLREVILRNLKRAPYEEEYLSSFDSIMDFSPSNYKNTITEDGRITSHELSETSKNIQSLIDLRDHFSLIKSIVNFEGVDSNQIGIDAEGKRYIKLNSDSEIMEFVAQHNGKPLGPLHKKYYKYLAVRHVIINTPFAYPNAGSIMLMDNVGFGDTAKDAATRNNMFQAIADNSDAVIVLSSPVAGGQTREKSGELLDLLDELREDEKGSERVNSKGLFVVLNERKVGNINGQACQDLKTKINEEKNREETVLIVDANNSNEVTEHAIIPILNQLLANLDQIDSSKLTDINFEADRIYNDLVDFCKELQDISFVEPSDGEIWGGIHKEIQSLIDDIETKLGIIYSSAEENKGKSFSDICTAMENERSGIYSYVIKKSEIEKSINTMGRDDTIYGIYNRVMTEIRSKISNAFEKAAIGSIKNLPQIEVKDKIFELLFNEAKWGLLPLKEGEKHQKPSEEWAINILKEYLNKFPQLKSCLEFILSYSISIDDYIDYQVESALISLDPHSNDYQKHLPSFPKKTDKMSIQEHNELISKAIYDGIYNHLTSVKEELKHQFDILAELPYHSVFARIRKFREKLLMSNQGFDELEAFYYKYARIFWPSAFIPKEGETNPISEWNSLIDTILNVQKKELYHVLITDK